MLVRRSVMLFVLSVFAASVVAEDSAESRALTVPSTVASTAARNPSITTSGTLAILSAVAFTASGTSSTNAAISYLWDFGDGTATDTRQSPSHTYTVPGNYTVSVTISEAGNATPVTKTLTAVITDAIKSNRLLSNLKFGGSGKDGLVLTGTLRVPAADTSKSATVAIDIGGVQASLTLDGKGSAEIKSVNVISGATTTPSEASGSFKIYIKEKGDGVPYEDAKFVLKIKGATILPAWSDENITSRDADRESVRVTAKITFNGVVYQSTLSPTYSAKKDSKATLR